MNHNLANPPRVRDAEPLDRNQETIRRCHFPRSVGSTALVAKRDCRTPNQSDRLRDDRLPTATASLAAGRHSATDDTHRRVDRTATSTTPTEVRRAVLEWKAAGTRRTHDIAPRRPRR